MEPVRSAFVFDLDGTLLNGEMQISERTMRALMRLSAESEMVIATARPPRAVAQVLAGLPFDVSLVYYNGALYHPVDGEPVSLPIANAVLVELFEFVQALAPGALMTLEVDDVWYSPNEVDFDKFIPLEVGPRPIERHQFLSFSPVKVLLHHCSIATDIANRFARDCNVVVTDGGELTQITSVNASKEQAVEALLAHRNIASENITCFGDDHNDMGLFRYCGRAVAMGNAVPALKAIASHVTDTNDNDGVAVFLEEHCNLGDDWIPSRSR